MEVSSNWEGSSLIIWCLTSWGRLW